MRFAVVFELDGRLIDGEIQDVLCSLFMRCLAIRLGHRLMAMGNFEWGLDGFEERVAAGAGGFAG